MDLPPDYSATVEVFCRSSVKEFRDSSGSEDEQRAALCRYLRRGAIAGITQGELIDYLGVSTPSILEDAGYSDEAAQRVMDMLAELSDDEIANSVV